MLTETASRLGINDTTTMKKAEEYLRKLQTRGAISSANDTIKTLVCLELAAGHTQISYDKKKVIELSGVRTTKYKQIFNIIEKTLGLNEVMTINNLCVQLNCAHLQDCATKILNKYSRDVGIQDLENPQYVAMAVYKACELNGMRTVKKQCKEASNLSESNWRKLQESFEKLNLKEDVQKKEKLEDNYETDYELLDRNEYGEEESEEIEDYQVWKRRILKKAYAALEMEKDT